MVRADNPGTHRRCHPSARRDFSAARISPAMTTTIRQQDLIDSVAAALQYISYYHPAS